MLSDEDDKAWWAKFRERIAKTQAHAEEEKRQRRAAYERQRASDPNARARRAERDRLRQADPEYRAKHAARQRARYAKQEALAGPEGNDG